MLFNVYTNDQPICDRTKHFIYADDLALTAQGLKFEIVENALKKTLEELTRYYYTNRLKPNPTKTQVCAFHLRNRDAKRKLMIKWNGVDLEYCDHPKYLGVYFDRSLTYKTHFEQTKAKGSARNNILRKHVGSKWGAGPHTLRTATLALCFSAGEYACPVWSRSAHAK